MADNISKIVGVVIGSAIVALQGVNVKETSQVSDEVAELTRVQLKTIEAMRETQSQQIYPELQKETKILTEQVAAQLATQEAIKHNQITQIVPELQKMNDSLSELVDQGKAKPAPQR